MTVVLDREKNLRGSSAITNFNSLKREPEKSQASQNVEFNFDSVTRKGILLNGINGFQKFKNALPVTIIFEADGYLAECSELELYESGDTEEEAINSLKEFMKENWLFIKDLPMEKKAESMIALEEKYKFYLG